MAGWGDFSMNECKLVQDLLPLYLDNELSEESAHFVFEHVQKCPTCQELLDKSPTLTINWEPVETPVNSVESFMHRWRRRRERIVSLVVIIVLLIAGGAWNYGQWSSQQAYQKQTQKQKDLFNKQLATLQSVSPQPQQLLNRWGISFNLDHVNNNNGLISLNYSIHWNNNSPIDRIEADNNQYWFDQDLLINADSGAAIPISSNGWGSGPDGLTGQLVTQPLTQPISKLLFKTHTLYAFLKGPETGFHFDYSGGQQTITLNQPFSFQGINFMIDSLQLNDKTFVVQYHQLTPATQVGVFQLDFAFDDRLGNLWNGTPELAVSDPKEFCIPAPHSPAKHWSLKINHIIQVIPGISSNIDLNGGEQNDK